MPKGNDCILRIRVVANPMAVLKNLILAAAFFVNTAVSMFVGIKVVVFDFSSHHLVLQAVMLGLAPVWINVEFILCRWIVEEWLKVKGVKFTIHHHPLFLKEMPCNWCDLCHQQIRERQGYRCDICDFDVCNACASKKDRSRAEGVLRGDGGVKEEKDIYYPDKERAEFKKSENAEM